MRPHGLVWLTGGDAVAELVYPAGSVVLVGGVPGAGKSTLLKRLFAGANGDGPRVLDSEDIAARYALRLGERRPPYALYRPLVHAEHQARIGAALAGAGSLVLHHPATRPAVRRVIGGSARARGRPCHALFLDADRELARAGQRARARALSGWALDAHLRRWSALRADLLVRNGDGPAHDWGSFVVLDRPAVDALEALRFE